MTERNHVVVVAGGSSGNGAALARRFAAAGHAVAMPARTRETFAESMARSLRPSGIHVSLIVIDGIVGLPRMRKAMPDKPDSFFIKPFGVAEAAFQLMYQDSSAWSFEVEARPFGEPW